MKAIKEALRTIPPALILPLGFAVVLTCVVITVSEVNYSTITGNLRKLRAERERIDLVNELHGILLSAETGQRGYLLTGKPQYLDPLNIAKEQLPKLQNRIAAGLADRPDQLAEMDGIRELLMKKLVELETTVQLVRLGERSKALEIVASDQGRLLTEEAQARIDAATDRMSGEFRDNRARWEQNMMIGRVGLFAVAILNLALLAFVVRLLARDQAQKARIVAMIDSENLRLGQEVAARTAELNELSTHLQQSTEKDKATLARDLHDELGGILTSAKMDVEWLRAHVTNTPETDKRFAQASRLLDDAVLLKRRVIENLRPSLLDNLGLIPALEWYVTEHCGKAGIHCHLNIEEEIAGFAPDASIALYRIVQEGLTNVLRHAHAKNFTITLRGDADNLTLVMQDDGRGLPASVRSGSLSHGLAGMRQRARALGGDVIWESVQNQGTTIRVNVPRKHDV